MTEAGRKWVDEQMVEGSGNFGGFPEPDDVSRAEFWIRAFCESVEKNTDEWVGKSLGAAFIDVKRELLGE